MDIGLTPREIQTRVRGGASLAEVAEAAGVPAERIEAFAAPVLAEREHIAQLALAAAVRRRGEASAHRTLQTAVTDRLGRRGIADDQVTWDAWRREDRRWTLVARYELGAAAREAVFHYNQQGRISEPSNDDARWLAGELSALPGDPDDPTEPTVDLNDEFALVRALRETGSGADSSERGVNDPGSQDSGAVDRWPTFGRTEEIEGPDPSVRPDLSSHVPLPRSQATPQDIGQEIEAQLSTYAGQHDAAGLDLLYDLFDTQPEVPGGPPREPEQPPLDFGDDGPDPAEVGASPAPARTNRRRSRSTNADRIAAVKLDPVSPADSQDAGSSRAEEDEPTVDVTGLSPKASAAASGSVSPSATPPASRTAGPDAGTEDAGGSETDPMGTDGNHATPSTAPDEDGPEAGRVPASDNLPDVEDTVSLSRTKKRRKRASVPTWDEIMFGGDNDN